MKPAILVILDGYGIASPTDGNAIELAHPNAIHKLTETYPSTILQASGEAAGLPYDEVGNTEVGHLNLGAGRVVLQSLPRINMSIADRSFYSNKAFLQAVSHVKKTKGKLHLLGLVGEHHVHSSIDHLYALLNFCHENEVENCFIHIITDGRDSPPKAAAQFITPIEELTKRLKIGKIASVMGRFYALDRDLRWERIERAYRALTKGEGTMAGNWRQVIESSYDQGKSDEFIEPSIIIKQGKPVALIEKGDSVIFFNFRIDRPRELTKAFVLDKFEQEGNNVTSDPYETKYRKSHLLKINNTVAPFERGNKIENLYFATMTEYEKDLPVAVAFPPHAVKKTLGWVLQENNLKQLRIAESEKERFVTIYFSGLHEKPFKGEKRIIIPSPHIATYDLQPEMAAYAICNEVIDAISNNKYAFILVNFANADMVGHTGNLESTIKAIKVIDECVDRISLCSLQNNCTLFITGDHGNAEEMIDAKTGQVSTEHTSNPVPFIVVDRAFANFKSKMQNGLLADVAPTILSSMGLAKPVGMTGRDLLDNYR